MTKEELLDNIEYLMDEKTTWLNYLKCTSRTDIQYKLYTHYIDVVDELLEELRQNESSN